jgi:hypothetical protein
VFSIGGSTNKRIFDLRVSINSDFITVVSDECNVNCDKTSPYRKRDSNIWSQVPGATNVVIRTLNVFD